MVAAQQAPGDPANQNPPKPATTETKPPTPDKHQATPPKPAAQEPGGEQPGTGAQVHTGTSSGIDADTRLQNLLADHQYSRVEQQLGDLPPDQARLYRGILANRKNDLGASIGLLQPLVDKLTASEDAEASKSPKPPPPDVSVQWIAAHEKLLRKALAEDYLRSGNLGQAARAYAALDTRLHSKLSADELDEIEMPLKMLPLAMYNPAMTAEPADSFSQIIERNPLGLIDIPVFVDARPHSWMLDPTSPFNLISRSIAREAGLKLSEDAATIHTLTGQPIQVHSTVIPRFTIAGKMTLRNVTAFVYEDKDYSFPQSQYQVEGVLGYPALAVMGSITLTSDDIMYVRPAKQINPIDKDDLLTDGARFYLDGDQIILALGKPPVGDAASSPAAKEPAPGEERMFVVDEGGQQTYLTARYCDEHASEFTGQKMQLFTVPGSQNLPPQPAYLAETIPLQVGSNTVHIHFVQVLTQPLGQAALDDVYGVLGIDALDQLQSYTFDYRTMRFGVKPE